jgi:hypothetical protein
MPWGCFDARDLVWGMACVAMTLLRTAGAPRGEAASACLTCHDRLTTIRELRPSAGVIRHPRRRATTRPLEET